VRPIVVDCDPGHDDAIALLLALSSREVDLRGVTTVYGNHTVENTTANAIRVLDYVGRSEIPVVSGATRPLVRAFRAGAGLFGERGLDGCRLPAAGRGPHRDHAIDWLADTLAGAAEPVTLVATGPLTNLALLVARYPDIHERVGEIVLMGGSIGTGNVTPAAEFNVWADPEAASRVWRAGIDLTMVGLDVTERAVLSGEGVEELASGGRAGRLAAELHDLAATVYRDHDDGHRAVLHDVVAMAYVVDPTVLTTVRCGVVVDTGPEPSRGRTYVDRWQRAGWEPNCSVAVDIDVERFADLLVRRVAAFA
jgi:inosine-uridine nucleoside N-ribohydrolase